MIKKLVIAIAILAVSSTAGYSRPRHKHHQSHQQIQAQQPVYNHADGFVINYTLQDRTEMTRLTRYATSEATVIGGRPPGCPHRYCGCAAALKIFGKIVPELNLAANWVLKFARTTPAPGMAAARSGHVFVLLEPVNGNIWRVYDGNSGGGRTRIHERSIAGYVIVDPQRPRHASL